MSTQPPPAVTDPVILARTALRVGVLPMRSTVLGLLERIEKLENDRDELRALWDRDTAERDLYAAPDGSLCSADCWCR